MKPLLLVLLATVCLSAGAQQVIGLNAAGVNLLNLTSNNTGVLTNAVTNTWVNNGVTTSDLSTLRYFFIKSSFPSVHDTLFCYSLANQAITKYVLPTAASPLIEYSNNKIYLLGNNGFCVYDLANQTYTVLATGFTTAAVPLGCSTFDQVHGVYYCIKAALVSNKPDTVCAYNTLTNVLTKDTIPTNKLNEIEYSPQDHALYGLNTNGVGKYDLSTKTYSLVSTAITRQGVAISESTFDPANNILIIEKSKASQAVPDTFFKFNLNTLSLSYILVNWFSDYEYLPGNTVVFPVIQISNFTTTQLCAGQNFNLSYTASQPFNNGNLFTAQLSGGNGSFANPVNIGSVVAVSSGTIPCQIPQNITYGTGYRIRIVSTSPVITSADNGFNINITPFPAISISTNSPVCENDSLLVAVNTQPGITYEWKAPRNKGAYTYPASLPGMTLADTGIYPIRASGNGCTVTDSVHIVVKPLPAAPAASYNKPLCDGDTLFFLLTNADTAATYKWAGPNGFSSTASTPFIPNAGFINAGNYGIYANRNGCQSATDTLAVAVTARPPQPLIAGDSIVCEDYGLTVYVQNSTPGVSYTWWTSNGFNLAADTFRMPKARPDQSGVYHIQAYKDGCPSVDKTINIVVKPNAHPALGIQHDGCTNEIIKLDRNEGNNVRRYTLDLGMPDDADSILNTYKLTWQTPGTKILSIVAEADNGCISMPFTDSIHIHTTPSNKIQFNRPDRICSMDSLLFSTDAIDGYHYKWQPEAYFLNNDNEVVYARVFDKATLQLTVTDDWQCMAKDSIDIFTKPCCQLSLPDAFTPNNDGHNDVFRMITDGNHTIKTFIIKNRWGQTVYRSADENAGWDGRVHGIPAEGGVYYYYLRYTCNNGMEFEKKGDLTLVR